MTKEEMLIKLYKDIHSIAVGTLTGDGKPFVAFMDIMCADETGIYVSTSRSKPLYRYLNTHPYISIAGMCGL